MREGEMTALVLAGDPSLHAPSQLTSAMRIRNGWPLEPEARIQSLRGYVLHTPCRQIVRDVYIAESLLSGRDAAGFVRAPGPAPVHADSTRGRPSPLLRGGPRPIDRCIVPAGRSPTRFRAW